MLTKRNLMKEIRKINEKYDKEFYNICDTPNLNYDEFTKALDDSDKNKKKELDDVCKKYGVEFYELSSTSTLLNYKDLHRGWYLYDVGWADEY